MSIAAPDIIQRIRSSACLRKILVALFFLSISLVFFNKVFTSDYGIHLSIGRHMVETGEAPHKEFLIYPLLGQPMNYEELGFQVILYTVYRLVDTEGVSVFVWMMATLSFFFVYKSLRARDINPYVALFTMMLFAMPFRIRLQPRPELIPYLFCSYVMYACSLFYYRGNRRILYSLPPLFLVWANLHPSTLAGLATVGAFGTQSLVIVCRERFSKASLKSYLYIPLGVFAASILASFLSRHGLDSVLTPLRLVANVSQTSNISEMTPVTNSTFYGYYRYLLVLVAASGAAGLLAWRVRIHDLILAAYGLRLPLLVARGIAFMSIFAMPLVAQSFDGILKRVREYMDKRAEDAARAAALKGRNAKAVPPKTRGKGKGAPQVPVPAAVPSAPAGGGRVKRILPVAIAFLVFFLPIAYGTYYIRTGTADILENGIGLTEHKFSMKSAEFLRSVDIKGNMFNFFDLGGFLDWQLHPQKLTFIDGRAGNPEVFMEHQAATSAMGDVEGIFRKYGITYIVTKTVDSSGMVMPLINYLARSPAWELVFADGLAVVFVRNIPENRPIIDRYRLPKEIIGRQVINELVHSTFLGVGRAYAYSMAGSIYMSYNDPVNAKRFYTLAYENSGDPNMAAMIRQIDTRGRFH